MVLSLTLCKKQCAKEVCKDKKEDRIGKRNYKYTLIQAHFQVLINLCYKLSDKWDQQVDRKSGTKVFNLLRMNWVTLHRLLLL